jgi:hypothetical protein
MVLSFKVIIWILGSLKNTCFSPCFE